MYLLQPVTIEFRSGLNKILLPVKNTKIGKVVRNVVAGLKRKFKVRQWTRKTKTGKTITVNLDKPKVANTVSKVASPKEPSKYLILNIPADKYKGEYLMKGKTYKADELFDIDAYRTIGDKPLLTGKNVNKKYKATRTNKNEYDSRYLNIDITTAPKELQAKLGKGASSIDKLDAYRELEKLGLLNKNNVKATRRYKLGAESEIVKNAYYKLSNKLITFARKKGSRDKKKRNLGAKTVTYNGVKYKLSASKPSTAKNKKRYRLVTNTATGKTKKVNYGYKPMDNYGNGHRSEKRRNNLEALKDELIDNGFNVTVVACLDSYDIEVTKYAVNDYEIGDIGDLFLFTNVSKDIVLSDKCIVTKEHLVMKPRRN